MASFLAASSGETPAPSRPPLSPPAPPEVSAAAARATAAAAVVALNGAAVAGAAAVGVVAFAGGGRDCCVRKPSDKMFGKGSGGWLLESVGASGQFSVHSR